jgi:hypothetical protein
MRILPPGLLHHQSLGDFRIGRKNQFDCIKTVKAGKKVDKAA